MQYRFADDFVNKNIRKNWQSQMPTEDLLRTENLFKTEKTFLNRNPIKQAEKPIKQTYERRPLQLTASGYGRLK